MGASFDLLSQAATTMLIEANAVSDNPMVFADIGEVQSGGNFHAEPVAFAADQIAIATAEGGTLSGRSIALWIDARIPGLPAFMVADSGHHSSSHIGAGHVAAYG